MQPFSTWARTPCQTLQKLAGHLKGYFADQLECCRQIQCAVTRMAVLPKNLDTDFRNILTKDFSPDLLRWQVCGLKKWCVCVSSCQWSRCWNFQTCQFTSVLQFLIFDVHFLHGSRTVFEKKFWRSEINEIVWRCVPIFNLKGSAVVQCLGLWPWVFWVAFLRGRGVSVTHKG